MAKKNKPSFVSLGLSKSKSIDEETPPASRRKSVEFANIPNGVRKRLAVRNDSLGHNPHGHIDNSVKIESLSYQGEESDVFRAYNASQHYLSRGKWWNDGKPETMTLYMNLTLIGLIQGTVAYFTNFYAKNFIDDKFDKVEETMIGGFFLKAFLILFIRQGLFAAWASSAVMIEPMSGGSGIPEVKCFLNGIDLPRINDFKTGVCKILGVIGSVSAGLPVGKEGPMVHSGSVVATTVSKSSVKDDKKRRDYVACGSAAGVCTAFSAPIGGFLFAFEEGASYWSQALTFRTFYTSGWAIATLYIWKTIGAEFGQVGFDKLFSFGNFSFNGDHSSYAVWELLVFIAIGCMGGLIGAIFNDANERITRWRMKYVNHTPALRFIEVMCISSLVSICMFCVPHFWKICQPLPDETGLDTQQIELIGRLKQFNCEENEFNPTASLFLVDGNDAIKLLFHMHHHTFPLVSLIIFFLFYISLATVTYGIAVPSGLFVPSLLSGAAFGRLIGNVIYLLRPNAQLATSNVYSLIGAAAVLGGMARMTISLTVILLECTGNEQYVLPLMIALFCARVVGGLFNNDLYHIHIHLKKGVHFLDHELRSILSSHNLLAGHIMSRDVVFVRPIERVSVIYDILTTTDHSLFPVIDTTDKDILYGTITRNALCMLLQSGAFGKPKNGTSMDDSIIRTHVQLDPFDENYVPLVQYKVIEREYANPKIEDIRVGEADREKLMDIRPYCNTAPNTVQELTSVQQAYQIFRGIGLKILIVVNKYNQCVGVISRDDLLPESLGKNMISKGQHIS